MKLYIFSIWQGYVCEEYYPIVAETEQEAREFLAQELLPKWKKRIKSTADYIRKKSNGKRYPRKCSVDYDDTIVNSPEEDAKYYYRKYLEKRKEQLKTCEFVSVELPLLIKGIVNELFHDFME